MKRHTFAVILLVWVGSLRCASTCIQADEIPTWVQPHQAGRFSLREESSARSFVSEATTLCLPADDQIESDACDDDVFGRGERVRWRDTEGREVRLSRHAGAPFTLFQPSVENQSPSATTTKAIDLATLPLDLGLPISQLKVLGTGGLFDAGAAPGSYMWIAVADPATLRGVVIGWLTSNRGSGVLIPEVVNDRVVVRARLEFGRLTLPSQAAEALETLAIGEFADVRHGLEAYGAALGRIHRVKLKPAPCGYCTWYHAGASNARKMAALGDFAARELAPFGLSFLQIDDGWQEGQTKNGPRKNFTAHKPTGPYPNGMKSTAERITSQKFTPGLWFMPFAGTWDDPHFADRQSWFARREDGSPFDTSWGGSCLDMTHPQVQAYVRENVERIVGQWGYRYLKMDGLFTGAACDIQYVNDAYKDDQLGNSLLSNVHKTHPETLRDGLRLVRQAAGSDVFLLGCCAPQNMRSYGGAFGLVDAMRIGPDNGANVEGLLVGPRYGSRNYFLNGRLWWNDPDPIYIRPQLSLAQAELSCTWAAVAGQLTVASDEFERMPAERVNLLKRVMPTHTGHARPVDLFDRDLPAVWTVARDERTPPTVVGLFNFAPEAVLIDQPLDRLGLDVNAVYAAYEFWSGRFLPDIRGRLQVPLEPLGDKSFAEQERSAGSVRRCCAALAIRPRLDHPQLLSTSRHVTQGLVDVASESWDPAAGLLRGESAVVAGDPYELRILLPLTDTSWSIARVEVTPDDATAGVTAGAIMSADALARVVVMSPASRIVGWSIYFAAKRSRSND